MSDWERFSYKTSLYFKDVGFGFFFSLILGCSIDLMLGIEMDSYISWIIIGGLWVIFSIVKIKNSSVWLEKVIKEIQEDFDSEKYTYR